MDDDIRSVSIIGAGNVAHHVSKSCLQNGFQIDAVWSHTRKNAKILANNLGQDNYTNIIDAITTDSDAYIIAIKDDHIESVVDELSKILDPSAIVLHTSGTISSAVITQRFKNGGVFYPLQTFKKENYVDFRSVPICLYVPEDEAKNKIARFASKLSNAIYYVDDSQRKQLHVAAVFGNNFSNIIFHIAYDICQKHNLDFGILIPLLQNSINNITNQDPIRHQTGPAVRQDLQTIENHMRLLASTQDYQQVYQILTTLIISKTTT